MNKKLLGLVSLTALVSCGGKDKTGLTTSAVETADSLKHLGEAKTEVAALVAAHKTDSEEDKAVKKHGDAALTQIDAMYKAIVDGKDVDVISQHHKNARKEIKNARKNTKNADSLKKAKNSKKSLNKSHHAHNKAIEKSTNKAEKKEDKKAA